jgi:general secretion pathway protein A
LLKLAGAGDANHRLLATWGIALPADHGAAFCEHVKNHKLRCLAGRADWEALRRYNRPALLWLSAPDGATGSALLRVLGENDALLDIAGQTVRAPLAQLAPLWTGDYLLLWRPPVPQTLIGPGASGEAVRWLWLRLALAAGQPAPDPVPETFDATLADQVRAFQRHHGLLPDGLAGPRTLVLLSRFTPEPDSPVLQPAGEKR